MIVEERMRTYLNSLDMGNTPFLEELERQALEDRVPIIRKEMQSFLKMMLTATKPASILEVGTAVGFSTLLMCEYGRPDLKVTTIENYEKRIPIARENFRRAGREPQICFLNGDAGEILGKLEGTYDLIFMDHLMPEMDGIETLHRLREDPENASRQAKVIMVNIKGGMVRINIANIYYIESQGHTLILHTILGDYETTGKMKEMDEKLSGMNFCRGNKGYLINLQHVDRIQDNCAVVKGEELVLSRARKKEFMEALTRYWGEVIK